MSRLTELLARLREKDSSLAADLEREVSALTERRAFGLNFERHVPEAVELPSRKVRKGDKVRVLPPRGETGSGDKKVWRVISVAAGIAEIEALEAGDDGLSTIEVAVEDLVVVAEFRDAIYPGLISTGKVERGGDKPYHAVINAENYHALQLLMFTHRGKVDCIYIDPPYNTGAKDWKYNNDYVEGEDLYRHSKWLAFMERRLLLAKELLNPDDSALIVTIDEKEYLRLGMLLEQLFPSGTMQMVSSVINPRGIVRANEFSRTNEFIFFVWFGKAQVLPVASAETSDTEVDWETMRRRSLAGARGRKGPGACGPNQFFPIYVESSTGRIVGRGDSLALDAKVLDHVAPVGTVAVFPARDDGTEMNWSLTTSAFDERFAAGYVRAGKAALDKPQKYIIQYILGGVIEEIKAGRVEVRGRKADGSVDAYYVGDKSKMPLSQWDFASHNAQQNGTGLLNKILDDRKFPYAKSLYAVEDALRVFVANKQNAVILDFFAGSGTTAHAVMRLNHQDGGYRQCILVTNNEVAAEEQKSLRGNGLRPSDGEWTQFGICEYITKPRIASAITGVSSTGEPIKGDYRFVDEFPMSDGLEENVEFLSLTYESPLRVAAHREFAKVSPILWMRAGSRGRRVETILNGWDVADTYGILVDLDRSDDFVNAVFNAGEQFKIVYIVTDEDRLFESIARSLPDHVEPVRLYESYLRNFEIESGRGMS